MEIIASLVGPLGIMFYFFLILILVEKGDKL